MLAALKVFGRDLYRVWDLHGTKAIGIVGTLLGTLGLVDARLFREALGDRAAVWLLLIGGIAGTYRGLRGTQTLLQGRGAQGTPHEH